MNAQINCPKITIHVIETTLMKRFLDVLIPTKMNNYIFFYKEKKF